MSSKDDPIESASKGATKAVLDYSEEKIKDWIVKFKNRKLAFIEDRETINETIEHRKTGEWSLFKHYVESANYHILFTLGLTLRSHEKKGKNLHGLHTKIIKKHELKGLHIAYFVQNGLFSKYLGFLLEKGLSTKEIKVKIKNLFDNIENTTIFIQTKDSITNKTSEILGKIRAHNPETFIISSTSMAIEKCEKVKNSVMPKIKSQYDAEIYTIEDEKIKDNKRIYFLSRKNILI